MSVRPQETALGGKIVVPTISGRLQVNLPADSRGGKGIHLKGKGTPAEEAGDLYLSIHINIPSVGNGADRVAWEKSAGRSAVKQTWEKGQITTQSSDVTLTSEGIVTASRCRHDWLLELIVEDIINIDSAPEKSTFSGFHLVRICCARCLSRDFEAGIPALGLIMQLLDEVEGLRKIQRPLVPLKEEQTLVSCSLRY